MPLSKKDQEAGLIDTSEGGASVAKYNPNVALKMMQAIAEGKTITELVKEPGLPSRSTFYRWLLLYPELNEAYEAARELSAQSFEEEALDMARFLKGPNDFTAVKVRMYEVAMAQLRWSAARRDPKRYGQKQEASLIVPVQINTTLDMGNGRTPTVPQEGTSPDAVYELEAIVSSGDPIIEVVDDAFSVPDLPARSTMPQRKGGATAEQKMQAKGKHKTKAQISATLNARNSAAKRRKTEDGSNGST